MAFPKTIEHSKHYLVNIQVFGDRFREDSPEELNYLATSFEINQSGGADYVHQKGRTFASAFATQPKISITIKSYMKEADFAILVSSIISEQQQILVSVGRISDSVFKTNDETSYFDKDSALIFEAIGYMNSAKIIATAGEFVAVDFTINADDINKIRLDDIPSFNP